MPKFSKRSLDTLAKAHPDLQRVANEAIKHFDFTVIESYRGKEAQNKAHALGNSKAKFGQSPHNFKPSLAIDIVPYPLDWNNLKAFDVMGAAFLDAARKCGIEITWGKNFTTLKDYPHFELRDWRNRAKGVS
jgi:peptidoglycan L-alanyl-D-glutamate endopeptidase CwlK